MKTAPRSKIARTRTALMPQPPVKFTALFAAVIAAFAAAPPPCAAQARNTARPPATVEEGHIHLEPLPPAIRVIAPEKLLGSLAPDFSLPDSQGAAWSLQAWRGKWVVLAFYPVVLDGETRTENRSLSTAFDRFTAANAVVAGISTQDVANQKTFAQKDALRHPLLADVGGVAARAFRVRGNRSGFAERVTIYVAPDGSVARVDEAVRPATAGEDALAVLADLARTWKPGKQPPVAAAPENDDAASGLPLGTLAPPLLLTEATAAPAAPLRRTLDAVRAGKKATALVFLSVHCPCSNSYNARLSRLAAEYAGRSVALVGINANASENSAAVAVHAKKNNLTFPVFKDVGGRVADALGAQCTPEAFVFDAAGRLVFHGPVDDSRDPAGVQERYLARALDAVLSGAPVPPPTTKAIGCAIERASPTL